MEDISRELEKEITQLKPSPYKRSRKKRILTLDDFGEMKSAGYLKVLVYIFGLTSMISLLAAVGFYYFFSNQGVENKALKTQLIGLEKKVDHLLYEKEVLMARLVISGIKPGVDTQANETDTQSVKLAKEKKAGIKEKSDLGSVKPASKSKVKGPVPMAKIDVSREKQNIVAAKVALEPNAPVAPVQKNVAIEKFTVTRDGADGNLLVRFDIRNVSKKPGGVSGRIFTILKPTNKSQKNWLVVPLSKLENGVPIQYNKGQYFSIAHFKPVKFRIENQAGPDFFKKAAIYIYNDNGDLMFESLIDITEEKPKP